MNGSGFSFAHTRAAVSDAEWQQRVDLAAAFRLAGYYRMTDQIYTHLTAKVPGTQAHFLINPYGVLFDEVTASCLVKVDIDGEVVFDPTGIGINPAGFLIHSCIHRARPDLHAVLHTHTAAGIAVAAQRRGLLNLSQHAMRFHRFGNLRVVIDDQLCLIAFADLFRCQCRRHDGFRSSVLDAQLYPVAARIAGGFDIICMVCAVCLL